MAKKLTNVYTYFIIIFFIVLFTLGLGKVSLEISSNENTNLDNDSIIYMTTLEDGINIEEIAKKYDVTTEEVEAAILINDNFTQGNPKDYALEFLLTKEKGFPLENEIKAVTNFPSFLIGDILRLPIGSDNWGWVINLISWFLVFAIGLALINYLRRGTD